MPDTVPLLYFHYLLQNMRFPCWYPMVHHHHNQWPSYVTCFFTFLFNIILQWILIMYWALQKHLFIMFPYQNLCACPVHLNLPLYQYYVLNMFHKFLCDFYPFHSPFICVHADILFCAVFPNTSNLHYSPWTNRSSVNDYKTTSNIIVCFVDRAS
jgi:hypothetical protein